MIYLLLLALVFILIALITGARVARKRSTSTPKEIVRAIAMIVVAVFAVIGLYKYVLGVYIIPSRSMEPTLMVGDRIVVNKFIYRFRSPAHDDVIVFKSPPADTDGEGTEFLVKRIIGLPGDHIQVYHGVLVRNGQVVTESYVRHDGSNSGPIEVPDGRVFVMGDNRGNSSDSRDWGTASLASIIGRANMIISPRSRLGYIQ